MFARRKVFLRISLGKNEYDATIGRVRMVIEFAPALQHALSRDIIRQSARMRVSHMTKDQWVASA